MIALQLTLIFVAVYCLAAHALILRKPMAGQSLRLAFGAFATTTILTLTALFVIKSFGSLDGRTFVGSQIGSIFSSVLIPVIATLLEIRLLKIDLRFGAWSAIVLVLLNLFLSGKVYIEFLSMIEPK